MNVLHTHLSETPALLASPSTLRRLALAAAAGFDAWGRAGLERNQLAHLDSRALHDLALSRADVVRELDRPVWRDVVAATRDAWRRA